MTKEAEEKFIELYYQVRDALRFQGVDEIRFNNAMRGVWETTGELQKMVEEGEF